MVFRSSGVPVFRFHGVHGGHAHPRTPPYHRPARSVIQTCCKGSLPWRDCRDVVHQRAVPLLRPHLVLAVGRGSLPRPWNRGGRHLPSGPCGRLQVRHPRSSDPQDTSERSPGGCSSGVSRFLRRLASSCRTNPQHDLTIVCTSLSTIYKRHPTFSVWKVLV